MRPLSLLFITLAVLRGHSLAQAPKMIEPPLPLYAGVTPPANKPATAVPAPVAADVPAPIPLVAEEQPPPNGLLPSVNAITPRAGATPSENVTINLINRLVKRGALTQADATELIREAEEDAAIARSQAQALADTQAAVVAQSAMPPVAPDPDEVRVTYIPEAVKEEIRSQLRTEVLEQAKAEKWAAPNQVQEWTQRIKLFGDLRMRQESLMYPAGNDNVTGAFPNFNLINTGAPFDLRNTAGTLPPQLNVDRNRDRTRLRMRLGFDIDLEDGFTAGIRLATGGNNSPVSTNQTLGSSNGGQGGSFSKYEIWLDRAFIKYEAEMLPKANLMIELGRFQNPFMASSPIMWDDDVNLDGIAFKVSSPWTSSLSTFLTAGAFPVFNSGLNTSDNNVSKTASYNKYLVAAQFGVEFKITKDVEFKSSIAYYDWENMEGRFSSPFVPASANDAGDTDDSRPLFAQKGNTYRPIRNITPTAGAAPGGNLNGTINQFQYFGLATKFRQIAWSGRLDFNQWQPVQVSLLADFVKNVGLDKEAMSNLNLRNAVVNNRAGGTGAWDGGDTAWYLGMNIGKPVVLFDKRGDWAVNIGYRHVESDAIIDAFADSRFGNGGTNMEGYTIQGLMALSKRTWMRLAYMSANQIAGPPLQTDVFLFEYIAKF